MSRIQLRSSDGIVFDTDIMVAKCCGTIKTMLEDCGLEEGTNEVIPILKVNSVTLGKVIQWAEYHKDHPDVVPVVEEKPEVYPKARPAWDTEDKNANAITTWDTDFLRSIDQGTLYELMVAANYLDIKGLLEVTCKAVANMIKGKSPEEIRGTFNIKNDFTPTEEKEIQLEHEWIHNKSTK